MTQAALQTERITLVPLTDEHFELEVELDSDPEVQRFIMGEARTREQIAHAHGMRMETAKPVDGLGFWMGFVDGEFVGFWMLQPAGWPETDVPGEAEMGFRLIRSQWGKGLAVEGAREMLRHAFEDLGFTRVFTLTMKVNERSQKTSAGAGMTYIRTFQEDDREGPEGIEEGGVEYAITADEWRAARSA
ncbi:GNAT family N-acetyltransferase [Microbacterium sp. ASV49]|uniref:GNAT family N-acetyltransferase n=1 Tax=Microbacterium candidum TaxID=3041922 RepID=A0ABT7MU19_9MICO|nr:GNAT family N-acetyltransferase [Microbacterium sp. ASV49]MDL9977949.1 GNAT family N-acetyltransferase [Microbacterium sp. ASV49]